MHSNVHCNTITTRTWKQPKCSSLEESIKKMWYIYTPEYYSAIKRNKIVTFAEVWLNLETIIQNEVIQKEKHSVLYVCVVCVESR